MLKRYFWLALLVPVSALAASPRPFELVEQIKAIQAEQTVQNERIRALELTDPVPGPEGPPGKSSRSP